YETHPLWAHAHTKILEDNGCVVTHVDNVDDAMYLMQACYFQIIILMDQNNPLFKTIYKHRWYDYTVVCVCSEGLLEFGNDLYLRFGERETVIRMNEILLSSKRKFYPTEFWQRIERELIEKELIGRLYIERPDFITDLSYQMTNNLIEHIEASNIHNELNSQDQWIKSYYESQDEKSRYEALRSRVEYEIFDLLRRCVKGYNIDAIQLSPIVSGLSKAAVIGITPKINGRTALPLVLKLGYHKEIAQEAYAYENHVQFMLQRIPKAVEGPSTPLLSSMIYTKVEKGKSFGEVYQDEYLFPTYKVEALLEDLFRNTCHKWFSASKEAMVEAVDYMGYLNCQLKRFIDPIEHLQKQPMMHGYYLWSDNFRLPTIDRLFANPFNYLEDDDFLTMLNYSAPRTITHGDMNANNILIRNDDEAWLIDFGRTDYHHALRDFIQLETVVRFALMEGVSLAERYEMESWLTSQTKFAHITKISQEFVPSSPQVERAFRITCKIRELAWETVLSNQDDTQQFAKFKQYQMGLFFMSLTTVRFVKHHRAPNGLSTTQALHALMAASLLGEQLAR
ncbi:MAG: phosphotransferase, partial [Chloroflexota bacterium]